jgi:16S rRNA (uracil1498-N3)-methyltransferase
MPRPRIHVPVPLRSGSSVTLPESAAQHLQKVLRLGAGDPITLFDGSGRDFEGVVEVAARTGTTVRVGPGHAVNRESPLSITLLQGISRGPRMDTVMQKATELGVTAIQPIQAARSVVRLDEERSQTRLEHWQRIVISACEQCGRSIVPVVRPVCTLDAALAALLAGTVCITLDPAGESGLASRLGNGRLIALAVGPEGGFDETEIGLLVRAGFRGLRLGPRILRTETAPLAALAVLQYQGGDLG